MDDIYGTHEETGSKQPISAILTFMWHHDNTAPRDGSERVDEHLHCVGRSAVVSFSKPDRRRAYQLTASQFSSKLHHRSTVHLLCLLVHLRIVGGCAKLDERALRPLGETLQLCHVELPSTGQSQSST